MKLSDFIKKLQEIEAQGCGDLPVALTDWADLYAYPHELDEDQIGENEGTYYSSIENDRAVGRFVSLGA